MLTVNFCGFLVGVLFAGPLCDNFGRRVVLIYGGIFYLLASFLCAVATDFPAIMLGRFFQGFTMTGPMIAGGVFLLEATSGAKQVFWMSLSNSAITFCMALTPIIGSSITNNFVFRGNLWSIFILGLIGILPAFAFVPESLPKEKRKPFQVKNLIHGYLNLLFDWRFMSLAFPVCGLAASYWIYVGVSALFLVDYLGLPASDFSWYQGPIVGCFSSEEWRPSALYFFLTL